VFADERQRLFDMRSSSSSSAATPPLLLSRAQRLVDLPAYKGHRPTMPPGLTESIEPIMVLLQTLGVPVLVAPQGYEADDVVASLVTHTDGPVVIMSADKDFYQLLTPDNRVSVHWPPNGPKDSPWFRREFGISPEQFAPRRYLRVVGHSFRWRVAGL
jgi:DNA polymerase-1